MYGGSGSSPCASSQASSGRSAFDAQPEEPAVAREHGRARAVVEKHGAADARQVARLELREGFARPDDALDEHLDAPAGRLASGHPRAEHARVVHRDDVVGRAEVDEVDEPPVGEPLAVDVQKAARAARRRRRLRDELGRAARSRSPRG
jgi:hypothetical protein